MHKNIKTHKCGFKRPYPSSTNLRFVFCCPSPAFLLLFEDIEDTTEEGCFFMSAFVFFFSILIIVGSQNSIVGSSTSRSIHTSITWHLTKVDGRRNRTMKEKKNRNQNRIKKEKEKEKEYRNSSFRMPIKSCIK